MGNTYLAWDGKAFPTEDIRKQRKNFYYQWVAFILTGQMLMLLAPKLIWIAFNWESGFNVRPLIEHTQKLMIANGELEGKERARHNLGGRIGHGILHHRMKEMKMDPTVKGAPRLSDYSKYFSAFFVTLQLLLLKLLNSCVVFIQLVLLNEFLNNPADQDKSSSIWGLAVIQDLWAGKGWRQSAAFPREIFCNLKIRHPIVGEPPIQHSFQCLIPTFNFNMILAA